MKSIIDVQRRAATAFNRNWRSWAACWFAGEECAPELNVGLQPPRESELNTPERIAQAREWVQAWRDCTFPGVEWQMRSWPSVGNQRLPVRVHLEGVQAIARWAQQLPCWNTAIGRLDDVRHRLEGSWSEALTDDRARWDGCASVRSSASDEPRAAAGQALPETVVSAVKACVGLWGELSDEDWSDVLLVWDWLFSHPRERRFVRQLPIRGIDTKWVESHGRELRGLYRAVVGADFAFAQPAKQFRCKACSAETRLGGCNEFSLSAAQLNSSSLRPKVVIICENLVNVLCLDDLPGTLAVHGSGYAAIELGSVSWLAETPILYWGDLDSNGFAILNDLRASLPHARSIMMDENTLNRYFDLCVNEPKPATGEFARLTLPERETLCALAQGDFARGIANLRLEQERIEWNWARERIESFYPM